MARELDAIDRRILSELQLDGRISNVELSRRVNLSPTPCLERVRRLERDGFIAGYAAILDPRLMDAGLIVVVEVRLEKTSNEVFERFQRRVAEIPEIMECFMMAGVYDYLLKIRIRDMDEYRALLGGVLVSLPGVRSTNTYVVMEEVKVSNRIPVRES